MTTPASRRLHALLAALASPLLVHCAQLSLLSSPPPAPVAAVPPPQAPLPVLKPVAELEGISEYRLPNGLKVVLFPDPSISTTTVNVTYRVGSRHEGPGEGGMAHLLEHMLFKDTPTRPNLKDALTDLGATWNGSTNNDRTNYFETFPSSDENLRAVLELEADRMLNCKVSADALASEMTVVRNEFERNENNPTGIMVQRMYQAAYLFHPYGKPTIGNQSDIERVPVDSLRRFYKTFYQPDNALLVIAGNIDSARVLRQVQEVFGALARPTRVLPEVYTVEPAQDGPRSIVLSRVGSTASTGLLYHIPAGTHADAPALDILAQVLGDQPSGRLYTALVKTGKAASANAGAGAEHDPGMFSVFASVPLDRDPEEAQRLLIKEVENVAGSIKPAEVERARNRMLKNLRLSLTNSRGVALALSESEATGDWRLLFVERDRLAAVTLDDVNRVARTYLIGSNRTAGLFRPIEQPRRAEIPKAPDIAAMLERSYSKSASVDAGTAFDATPQNIERSTLRKKVGTLNLAMLPHKTRGQIVRGSIRLEYGTAESLRGREVAAGMLPALMARGTAKRDFQGLRDRQDEIETQLNVGGDVGALEVGFLTTREHLRDAIELAAEVLRTPTLPAAELELLRKAQLTGLEGSLTDPQAQFGNALARATRPYPEGTVLYEPTLPERIERLRKLRRQDIAELHRRFVGAGHVTASFVGDFDPAEVENVLGKGLAGWESKEPQARIAQPFVAIQPLERTINTPDKRNAVIGRATVLRLRSDDPDYPALAFANYVLGSSRKSLLWNALREKGGLSYSVTSGLNASNEDQIARLTATAIAAPENALRAQNLMRGEFKRWIEQPIGQQQLEEFRTGYLESFRTQLSNDGFLLDALLTDARLGRPFTFRQKVVEAVSQITPEQLQAAIRKHLESAVYIDLLAGDAAKFGAPAGGGQ